MKKNIFCFLVLCCCPFLPFYYIQLWTSFLPSGGGSQFQTFVHPGKLVDTTMGIKLKNLDCSRASEQEGYGSKFKNEFQFQDFFSPEAIINQTQDCSDYFRVITTKAFETVTQVEKKFPLAFSHRGN